MVDLAEDANEKHIIYRLQSKSIQSLKTFKLITELEISFVQFGDCV